MYLRPSKRRSKDGSEVRYLQLAHNEWDAKVRQSVVRVIYSFGREDQLDRGAIARLISSLSRVLDHDQALAASAGELRFVESRPIGGAYALDGLWRLLGIDRTLSKLLGAAGSMPAPSGCSSRSSPTAPWSRSRSWPRARGCVSGRRSTGSELDEDACYRAMDWLLEVQTSWPRRSTSRPLTC